jgi:formate dehydrogenase major subunit
MREFKISRTTETRSTCPYCSVSCGVIIHTLGDRAKNSTSSVVHIEGDPDHPINRGTLCPKGIALKEDITHKQRLTKPRVRRPGSDKWEDISWNDAITQIAKHIKTRDKSFVAKNARAGRQPQPGFMTGVRFEQVQHPQWKASASWGSLQGQARDTRPRWPVWLPRSGAR